MKWRIGGIALVVALVAACSSKTDTKTEAAVRAAQDRPIEHVSTTTSTTIDVSKVPATIDARYVETVMAGLDSVLRDAVRIFVQDHGPSSEFETYLKAIYEDPGYSQTLDGWQNIAGQMFRDVRRDPGMPVTTVRSLIGTAPDCVFAAIDRDFSAFFTSPRGNPHQYIELLLKEPGRDPRGLNKTPWIIASVGANDDGSVPRNPCA